MICTNSDARDQLPDNLTVRGVSGSAKMECRKLIETHHYKGSSHPSYMHMFGLYQGSDMVGCATFGNGSNHHMKNCIDREAHPDVPVLELNRLVLMFNRKNEASFLVARALRLLPAPCVVVSYADIGERHIGTVYQATNWIYTGTTISTLDRKIGHRHSRTSPSEIKSMTAEEIKAATSYVWRSRKHRYIFICGSKTDKRRIRRSVLWQTHEGYPKEDMSEWKWIPRGHLKYDKRAVEGLG